MSTARLWFRRNVIGNRFASRRDRRAWVDAVVLWWCVLLTFSGYVIGWPL